ncbi:sulfotransferase 1A1-like, partial [Saccoglossus kowalevskii]|uniref:Sulfotransferase 1A1-like n=1 Tax=Saccoglossus kowalevskii TaxID=10224 RepID=A0ABM0M2L1_SACKO
MNSASQDKQWKVDTHTYKGITFPLFMPQKSLEAMDSFEVRPDDVFICTFAKSGTLWITEIVWRILSHCGVFVGEEPLDKGPYPDYHIPGCRPNYEILAEMPSPRLMATHLPSSFLPAQLFDVRPK